MKLASKMALYKYFTRKCLTYPTKVPSLSDKEVEKTNAEVKRVLEEDTSGCSKYNDIRQKKEHRLESSPLNMDPQRQSDISQRKVPETMAKKAPQVIYKGKTSDAIQKYQFLRDGIFGTVKMKSTEVLNPRHVVLTQSHRT